MSAIDRKILEQDVAQHDELTKKIREQREKEAEKAYQEELKAYEKEQKEYDKQQKQAEEQYQKDLDRYNRELAEYNKQVALQKAEAERIPNAEKQFKDRLAQLESEKAKALAEAHESVFGKYGSQSRSDYESRVNTIIKGYEPKIQEVEKQRKYVVQEIQYSLTYPNAPLTQNVRKTAEAQGISLSAAYEKIQGAKQARSEYQRETSLQQVVTAPRYTSQQEYLISKGFTGLRGTPTEEMSARGKAIKPTTIPENIFPTMPMQASDTRRPLTGVDTGQRLSGQLARPEQTITSLSSSGGFDIITQRGIEKAVPTGRQTLTENTRIIPARPSSKGTPTLANPLAKLAALTKPVPVEGSYTKPVVPEQSQQQIFSFQNIKEVKDPSAVALLQFQSQLKTETAPAAGVYRGILQERGLKETPLSKRIIDVYSSKPVKEYSTRAEAFGLAEAKGRKGIISDPLGAKLFDLQTGEGSIRIGRMMGFKYSKPVLVSDLGEGVQGPPAPQYVIPDAFGNPRTDKSGNLILLKSEKATERLAKTEKASKLTVPTLAGPVELKVEQPKRSWLGTEIGRGLEQFESDSQWLEKNPKSKNLLLATYQTIAPIGLATGKSIGSLMAFGVNYAEQTYAPFLAQKLGLKEPKKVEPISVPETSGLVVLPVNFEKLDLWKPQTYGSAVLNPLEKEYQSRQKEYIKKYGPLEYTSGIVFDYGGLKGGSALIRSGGKITTAPLTIIKGIGRPQVLTAGKKGISIPSKSWDVIGEKIGIIKKEKTKPATFGKITTQKPEPNPFGKERRIPYAIRQAEQQISSGIQEVKTQAVKAGRKTKEVIQRDVSFPNRSLIEGRNIRLPNITRPTAPEFSPLQESIRIGLNVKKSALAKKLAEMENIYRVVPESTPGFSPLRESVSFGLRMKRKEFGQTISGIKQNIPKLTTPKGIIKLKKEIIFIGKRTSKGIEKRKQDLYKSIIGLKPTFNRPYFPQKTSLEISKFKQKEKLSETLARMKKITTIEEKPKVIVPKYGKNFLSRLKSGTGVQEPWDFKSIFRRPKLRQEFQSNIRGSSIGKIKGTTSRKEFARLLTESDTTPIASVLKKAKSNLFPEGSYDLQKQILLGDIGRIRRKGLDIVQRRQRTFDALKKSFLSYDVEQEIIKSDLRKIGKKKKSIQFIPKYSIKDLPATSPDYAFKDLLNDVGKIRSESLDILRRKEKTSKALSGALSTPDTELDLLRSDIGKIKSKYQRITRLRSLGGLKSPPQTIKPIFPVPKKTTELEDILQGFKAEKPKGQLYKRVRIDKYIPKTPKEWESWKGVGIVTAAGTLTILGIGGEQKAEALPFASLGKIATRQIESGGQILIYPETKGAVKPTLIPPIPKVRLDQDEGGVRLTSYPEITKVLKPVKFSLKVSQPQRIETSFKISTVQPQNISILQRTETKQRQPTKQKEREKYVLLQTLKIKQTPRIKQEQKQVTKFTYKIPEFPKQPARLTHPSKFKQPVRILFKYRTPTPQRPPRVFAGLLPPKENKIPKSVLKKQKEKADFLGTSAESQLEGFFKRQDITYGQKKIEKLLKGDIRVLSGKPRTARKTKEKRDILGFSKKKKPKFF